MQKTKVTLNSPPTTTACFCQRNAASLSHSACFGWRAALHSLVVFLRAGEGSPKKTRQKKCSFSFNRTPLIVFSLFADLFFFFFYAASGCKERLRRLRRCLKVNVVNSILFLRCCSALLALSPSPPPSPCSRRPSTSPHLFSPSFSLHHPLCILPASCLLLGPLHPSPRPRLSGKVVIAGPFCLAACISPRPPAYLLSLHCETNQWCARLSGCVCVRVLSGLTAPLLAAC